VRPDGSIFSFEQAGIEPDVVTLAKSLSGMGLPFALTLFRPELDLWEPGEHNGTFRGNCHAFVTATAALRHFWQDDEFADEVARRAVLLEKRLGQIASRCRGEATVKGRGMMRGIDVGSGELAAAITSAAFDRGIVIETSGARDEVVKVLAPLTIEDDLLATGLIALEDAFREVMTPAYGAAA
jgi:diaminobutyrate-2-oxoglutarate transaminase